MLAETSGDFVEADEHATKLPTIITTNRDKQDLTVFIFSSTWIRQHSLLSVHAKDRTSFDGQRDEVPERKKACHKVAEVAGL